jgi:very-short-patch-repair endonuclease
VGASLKHCLIVEVDGGQHNLDTNARRDVERDHRLAYQGFRILRFWNNDIDRNLEEVLTAIDSALHEPPPGRARARPPSPASDPQAGEG